MIRVASVLLGLACGVGAAVWALFAHINHRMHPWHTFWYTVLSLAYIATAVIISGRLVGRFVDLSAGFSILLLLPIIAVPPALQFAGWLKARVLIRQQQSCR